jgi:hypothetical protein
MMARQDLLPSQWLELAMHFVDDAEVTRVLSFPVLIYAIEKAHRRQKIAVLDGCLGNEKEQYVVRSAADPGRYMATPLKPSVFVRYKHHRQNGRKAAYRRSDRFFFVKFAERDSPKF